MTQDEIIEMAKQAGFLEHLGQLYTNNRYGESQLELIAFAKLVAAKATASEREACAEACEQEVYIDGKGTAKAFAKIIRARGQA